LVSELGTWRSVVVGILFAVWVLAFLIGVTMIMAGLPTWEWAIPTLAALLLQAAMLVLVGRWYAGKR